MQEDQNKSRITRKPLRGKNINSKLLRSIKPNTSFSNFEEKEDKRRDEMQRNIALKINEQSISFIAKKLEGSFISNGQDRSLDSFDKMIIGIQEELDLEDDTDGQDPDFTFLYKEFERLCKQQPKKEQSELNLEDSVLGEERNGGKDQEEGGRLRLATVRERLEEVKELIRGRSGGSVASDPNISIRLLGANLSEIHEEQIQHNSSLQPMDPVEEEFIDFVSTGQGPSRINISKIEEEGVKGTQEKKKSKHDPLKETQEDEVVAMLENELVSRCDPQEQSLNDQQVSLGKKGSKKESYNPILCQLQDNEDKKNNQAGVTAILNRRREWVNNRSDRSQRWKDRQMKLISRFRQILENAEAEFSDEQEQAFES